MFSCPRCGWASYNPNDAKYRYCGHCHVFVDDVMKIEEPLSVSIEEACRLTGLPRSTIFKLRQQGRLTWTRIGKRVLIHFHSLAGLLKEPPPPKRGRGRPPKVKLPAAP